MPGDPGAGAAYVSQDGLPTPAATIAATATITPTTAAAGTPTPPPTSTAQHVRPPLGDVNCDGRVGSIDAALILQFDAGLIDSLDCLKSGDVNEDGAINTIDATLILQFDAGLISDLPPPP